MKNLEEIMIAIVRGNYLTAANIELDAFSYPIPRQSGTKMTECFFLYSNQPVTKKLRPSAWCVVDSETGSLMQYNRCECCDFAANLNIPMKQQIDYSIPTQCGYRELRDKQREFAALYAKLSEFAFSDVTDRAQMEVLKQYKNLHEQLINPELALFYKELSPDFYEWAERILKDTKDTFECDN